ncbi:MAG TPA: hypothetical protein VGM80_07095, partial [Gaiellaceae bacterium]
MAGLAAAVTVSPSATAAKPKTVTVPITTTTTPFAQTTETKARLTGDQAEKILLAVPKVKDWLKRYPPKPTVDASFAKGVWTINVFSGRAGEIATGTLDDPTGVILSAWTGPAVAWGMARGGPGAFGGKRINSYPVWLGLCAAFLIGLVDWRRLFSIRNLDLVLMLSFSASLYYFNHANIFLAMLLAYPGMVWLLARCLWIGRRDRAVRGSTVWPVWLLIGATVFLAGFRIGLNVRDSNVIDVGLSGVIGAQRIATGVNPYGHFPIEGDRPACGPADASGEIRNRIQTNGHCEAADAQGDTYGPVSYEAYVPAYLVFGWSGVWDSLPTAHATSILWDLVCLVGLWLVGRRFGGARLAATLGFAWVAWPFSQYASSSNTNDSIQPAVLIFGLYFLTSPPLRGAFGALGALVKFAPLVVLPLWSGYPDARDNRSRLRFAIGALVASAAAFSILLFDPDPLHAAAVFFHHTFGYQVGRDAPFSLWDWGQYHAKGLPDLHWVQRVLQAALVVGALALYRWPRRRSPLQLAAYTAALLVGFELILTYWFYSYMVWFFPFVALALFAPQPAAEPVAV